MASTSDKGCFVLGVGAQKAGTTWLHGYLDQFDSADFGEIKEYHIWDGLTLPDCPEFDWLSRPVSLRHRLGHARRRLMGRPREPLFLRRKLQSDPKRYFDYFEGLLRQPGITMTGDITPSYSGLSTETLTQIRDGFAARSIAVKVVFLMREPVDRCRSAVSMFKRNNAARRRDVDISLPDNEAILGHARTPSAHLRGDYHLTLPRLSQVFAPEDTYIGLYETMFSQPEFERLNRFFGLTPKPEFLNQTFNQSSRAQSLSDETVTAIRAEYSAVYAYCAQHYPETTTLWA